jgi:hypothetical protein
MNKSNFQDIDLSIFEKIKSPKDFPLWLKISGGVLIGLVVLSLISLFLIPASDLDNSVNETISPTPTKIEQEEKVSSERKQWQTIERQVKNHDPLQKEFLPPEIDLNIEFEQ